MGWFLLLAALLLVVAFGYYLRDTAERKGWFAVKARYYTYANSGTGLDVGDHVKLMGFNMRQITKISAMPARGRGSEHNVYVEFEVLKLKLRLHLDGRFGRKI